MPDSPLGLSVRSARDGRALVIANLLRSGWTGQEVSVGLKIIDAGGGVELAMAAMRGAQTKRRAERTGSRSLVPACWRGRSAYIRDAESGAER